MITDYSHLYSSKLDRKKQAIQPRDRKNRDSAAGTWIMMRAVGLMVIVTLALGVSSTFWYGWQIQSALSEIGDLRGTQKKLTVENRQLLAQRDRIMTQESIEAAAKKLGLFPPSPKQIRQP